MQTLPSRHVSASSNSEIDSLIERSRMSFAEEEDSKLSEYLRVSALEDSFTVQMAEACDMYAPLIKEIFRHGLPEDNCPSTSACISAGCAELPWKFPNTGTTQSRSPCPRPLMDSPGTSTASSGSPPASSSREKTADTSRTTM